MKRTRKTSTKKRKRTAKDNYISMRYRIDALPGKIRKDIFLQTLLDFLNGEIPALPRGWTVTWIWRNSPEQDEREDEFTSTVAESRPSFMTLMERRLRRDLQGVRIEVRKRKSRKRSKSKKVRKSKRRKMPKVSKRKSSRRKRAQKH